MNHQTIYSKAQRWTVAPPDVERLEAEWWGKHSWLEDEYAWVHPPHVRHVLRKNYLKQIVTSLPKGGTIVDFGCGPGWLAIMLAELGAKHVIGIDNAPAQILIAKKKALDAGQAERIEFFDTMDPNILRSVDAVIIHGVLHHLAGSEIDALAIQLRDHMKSGSKIFVVEPVEGKRRYLPWSLPYHLLTLLGKMRRQTPEEQRIRGLLDARSEGPRYPGYGVAPKEMPFPVGELEHRLSPYFDVTPGVPVLFFSVRVAMELLLLSLSSPRLGRFFIRFGLGPYMAWERLSFRFAPRELWSGWVFCLFEAKPRSPAT